MILILRLLSILLSGNRSARDHYLSKPYVIETSTGLRVPEAASAQGVDKELIHAVLRSSRQTDLSQGEVLGLVKRLLVKQ